MSVTQKSFYVPSLEQKQFSFIQKILTVVLIVVIFAFAMTLRPKEIKMFVANFTNALQIFLEVTWKCMSILGIVLCEVFSILMDLL